MGLPQTAVIIPAHISSEKRLHYFHQTLESLTRQSIDVLGIIVDDNSPLSNDVERIVDIHNKKGNLRYVHRLKKPGESATSSNAINFGIDLLLHKPIEVVTAKEHLSLSSIAYLHSDDMLPEHAIQTRLQHLGNHGFVYSTLFVIDEHNTPKKSFDFKQPINEDAHGFPHHTILWSKDFLKEVVHYVQDSYALQGLFDPKINCEEDRDATLSTLLCAASQGVSSKYINAITYYYRQQPESIAGTTPWSVRSKTEEYIDKKHGVDSLPVLYKRLTSNLPWSLGTFLPPAIKSELREVKHFICGEKKKDVPAMLLEDSLIKS